MYIKIYIWDFGLTTLKSDYLALLILLTLDVYIYKLEINYIVFMYAYQIKKNSFLKIIIWTIDKWTSYME